MHQFLANIQAVLLKVQSAFLVAPKRHHYFVTNDQWPGQLKCLNSFYALHLTIFVAQEFLADLRR